jgi:hypothetical protein
MFQGVNTVPNKKKLDKIPHIVPVNAIFIANSLCSNVFLKNRVILTLYNKKAIPIVKAVIVKIIYEIMFTSPESDIVLPKSLKKLAKKMYPEVEVSKSVPPE